MKHELNEVLMEDIFEEEFEKAQELINAEVESTEYSDVSEMTVNIQNETESLVRDKKIPERSIISEVSTAELAIDLAMANLAKQTAVKLQKLEGFLGKIEDKLFKDDILEKMNKGDLLLLYTNTRMMRSDAFKMIREIRKDVDFSTLEANLMSLHAKESIKDAEGDDSMNSILQTLLSDENFLNDAASEQRDAMSIDADIEEE